MFLKYLEINGFKSFAGKSVLEFPSGITAVVGPNGSGKSNIIDAVRWLLGEREAKNLRGAKTEDLIWNGTPKRPRSGMAQASLCFDNESGFFPVDYKEIVITRRISRDGESEYLLNRAEIKLKDLIEFLNRSRLGTKGLIIINQGQSDIFVKATPEARRIMIEEILGLREYQVKKTEAERKLKSTLENLEKVKAMSQEVLPRLKNLRRQTEKWSKRESVEINLRNLENDFFSIRLAELEKEKAAIRPKLQKWAALIKEKRAKIDVLESELKKTEKEFKEPEELKLVARAKKEILEKRRELERELGGVEAKIEMFSQKENEDEPVFEKNELITFVKEIKDDLRDALQEGDFSGLKKMAESVMKKIDVFFSGENKKKKNNSFSEELAAAEKRKKSLILEISGLDEKEKALEKQEAEIASGLEGFNIKLREAFEALEKEREEARGLEDEKRRTEFETEKNEMRFKDLDEEIGAAGRKREDFNFAANAEKNLDMDEARKKMFRLRNDLAAIGEIDEALVKEAEEVRAHYDFLVTQTADMERAVSDLAGLIKELSGKIHREFHSSLRLINKEFEKFFKLMFKGGEAKLKISESGEETDEDGVASGVEIELKLPEKRINSLEMLSGGEKSLVSIAALFALISVSPPPFLVLDEIDAALDENNSRRLAELIKASSKHSQFVIVTHNRSIMEAADVLYGVTIADDGASKLLSLKLES